MGAREVRGHDMSEHWRLVTVEGERIGGTFWVTSPIKPGKESWVKAVDVIIWSEGRHYGRSLGSGDLTGSVVDGQPTLSKSMVKGALLADVEEVWDEMLLALTVAAETAFPAPSIANADIPELRN